MTFLYIILFINALVGLYLFEKTWKTIKPLREINEERDSKYPAFRRYDAIHW